MKPKEDSRTEKFSSFEDLFPPFMAAVPVRAWIKDSNGRYVYANARLEEDFGMPARDWIGKTDEELFADLGRQYRNSDLEVLATGKHLRATELAERNGKREYVFTLKFPIAAKGDLLVAGIGVEITQEILALEELQGLHRQLFRSERLRAVGELASGLAHDLNNSLNAAVFRLQLIRAEAGEDLQSQINALERSISDAAARVKGLQDFVRAGRETKLEPVDVVSLVKEAIEMVDFVVQRRPTIFGGVVRIESKLLASLPPILASPVDLKHVIANLLLNARDAMPNGGPITIAAVVSPSAVNLSVSDTGRGIPAEDIARIFEPFFTTKPAGTGLGLSMARDVVGRIGGQITAANRPEGGAIFTLSLPLDDRPSR